MIDIDIEFKKGVLFIRMEGELTYDTFEVFNSQVLSLVMNQGIRSIVINLYGINAVDKYGIYSLNKLFDFINGEKGYVYICNIKSNKIRDYLFKKCSCKCLEISNELNALRVINV